MIYLDNAATTPVAQEVLDEMLPFFTENYGNPSSLYSFGSRAKKAVDTARRQVANALNTSLENIFFTSGATESNNWIISQYKTVISSDVEHHSILNCPNVTAVPVDKLFSQFYPDTYLATCMMVNNETGNIYPIKELAKTAHSYNMAFHTDATQAFGKVPIDVKDLGVDSLSFSGHKIHAQKGIGVLYVKNPKSLKPFIHGGQQERNKRAGTENVPAIVGLGKACELYNYNPDADIANSKLKGRFIANLSKIHDIRFNSSPNNSITTTLSVSFKDVEGESLLLMLNNDGICVSSGSACTSGSIEPSHVLKAIGVPIEYIYGTIRISFGSDLTFEDVDYVCSCIEKRVKQLRGE